MDVTVSNIVSAADIARRKLLDGRDIVSNIVSAADIVRRELLDGRDIS
jgi:hypothetical protein